MKLLHTSDWHIGRYLNGYSLLEDQRYFLDRLCELVQEEQIDAVVIAGDLYDRSIPPVEAIRLLDDIFLRFTSEIGIPVLAIAGNHDSAWRLHFGSRLYRQSGLYLESVYQKDIACVTLTDASGPVHFYLLPFVPPEQLKKDFDLPSGASMDEAFAALMQHNRSRLDLTQRNVLVAHGFFSNMQQVEPMVCDSEHQLGGVDLINAKSCEHFDYVALGHLHTPQNLGCGTIRYAGSILKYSVSEARQHKSVSIVELGEKGEVQCRTVPIKPLRDLRVVSGKLEQLLAANEVSDDYIHVNLTDDGLVPDAMNRLRGVFQNILGLKVENREQEFLGELALTGKQQDRSPESLFCQFYEQVKGESIPPERKKLLQRIIREAGEEETR
ncbi:exonuclease SbcCD subunit D [Candidatus Soleaferrea massiliensis]|uniref:exonuclease SbcCD subunit D n=1 Tax=Candidatus Soleaferrea massiliensis TaxID=1470354 RepID=UPI00058EDB16|nr:exonuclease SbcCD subunit D [Candidatus Soleaferrea massiliensis]